MIATSLSPRLSFLRWPISSIWTVWLSALVLAGCGSTPCETSQDCGGGQVCAARLCQQLSCGQTLYLKDPDTGVCTPLSGCFLTQMQRGWSSCDGSDACQGASEAACLADARCQPAYATTQAVGDEQCFTGPHTLPTGASVTGQDKNFHAPLTCTSKIQRSYAGCRALPTLPAPCSAMDEEGCATRTECQWGELSSFSGESTWACSDRRPVRVPDCTTTRGSREERESSCLINPMCQPTGEPCYCPPGASCACSGGAFIGCEHNDRLRTCARSEDCAAGETCRFSSTCPSPRNGYLTGSQSATPCLGVCAASPCEGLDETTCHTRSDCTEIYGTECSDAASQYYAKCPLNPAGSAVAGCLCDNVFQRCAARETATNPTGIDADRSLLVRDPSIVADSAFRIDAVLSRFAQPGDESGFLSRWLQSYSRNLVLPSGARAAGRQQVSTLLLQAPITSIQTWLSQSWHTTALINRLDLLQPGDCGEARISFAYNGGYGDVSARMTVIVELKVPDDGHGCQQVAQQWAELSLIDDPTARLAKLKTLYDVLLRPEHLGQVRTNEFINPQRIDAWEMREWHLAGKDLVLAPAKQAVDPRFSGSPDLLAWVRANLDAVRAGTATVPDRFLAAAAPVDGKVIRLPGSLHDAALQAAEARLNKDGCAGCHLSATGTPFVHIGERLALKDSSSIFGRAVVSGFLRDQLVERARTLSTIWKGGASSQAMRLSAQLRVH